MPRKRATTVQIDSATLKTIAAVSGFLTATVIASLMNKGVLTEEDLAEILGNLREGGPSMSAKICGLLADGLEVALHAAGVSFH